MPERASTPSDVPSLLTELQTRLVRLSPKLQRAARFVLSQPETVAVKSMRKIAEDSDVHPTTMLRFARTLGFSRYEEFRELFRAHFAHTPPERLRISDEPTVVHHGVLDANHVHRIADRVRGLASPDMWTRIQTTVSRIQASRRTFVVGSRGGFPAAFTLWQMTRVFGEKIRLIRDLASATDDELSELSADDLLVVVDVFPRGKFVESVVDHAVGAGCAAIAITDSAHSPLSTMARSRPLITAFEIEGSIAPHAVDFATATAFVQLVAQCWLAQHGERVLARVGTQTPRRSEHRTDAAKAQTTDAISRQSTEQPSRVALEAEKTLAHIEAQLRTAGGPREQAQPQSFAMS